MTVVLRVSEFIFGVVFSHFLIGIMAWAIGVEGVALLDLRWNTLQSRASLGHISGSLEAFSTISLPLIPFFWLLKVSIINVASKRSASVDVAVNIMRSQLKVISSRPNGALSDLNPV